MRSHPWWGQSMGLRGYSSLEKAFHFRLLGQLERKIKSQSTLQAADFQHHLELQIGDLSERLAIEPDRPTWGPRSPLSSRDRTQADPGTGINANLVYSQRMQRFGGLYLLAILVGMVVAAGALYFDYHIMTEFWTRVLADEFMEVPPSLVGSVVSKSAQVIFATAAFHFLLSSLPSFGRKLFIWVFFLLTFGMIAGFGLLNANISMPADPEALAPSAGQGPTSLKDALGDLGLIRSEREAVAPASPPGQVETWIRNARPVLWLVVPGLVFLVVTGIGALCLQLAEVNLTNFVTSRDYTSRRKEAAYLAELQLYKTLVDRLVEERA